MIVFAGLIVTWLHASPLLLKSYLHIVILSTGVAFGNIVGRMIVAHVVHDRFPYWNWNFLPLLLGALNAYSDLILGYFSFI